MNIARPFIVLAGLVVIWQVVVWATGVPFFILPGPAMVANTLVARADLIADHAGVTFFEIVAGLLIGAAFGGVSALTMSYFRPARRWLLPVLVISQAVPVFALAPLLVLWLGYGLTSKIAMARRPVKGGTRPEAIILRAVKRSPMSGHS